MRTISNKILKGLSCLLLVGSIITTSFIASNNTTTIITQIRNFNVENSMSFGFFKSNVLKDFTSYDYSNDEKSEIVTFNGLYSASVDSSSVELLSISPIVQTEDINIEFNTNTMDIQMSINSTEIYNYAIVVDNNEYYLVHDDTSINIHDIVENYSQPAEQCV